MTTALTDSRGLIPIPSSDVDDDDLEFGDDLVFEDDVAPGHYEVSGDEPIVRKPRVPVEHDSVGPSSGSVMLVVGGILSFFVLFVVGLLFFAVTMYNSQQAEQKEMAAREQAQEQTQIACAESSRLNRMRNTQSEWRNKNSPVTMRTLKLLLLRTPFVQKRSPTNRHTSSGNKSSDRRLKQSVWLVAT